MATVIVENYIDDITFVNVRLRYNCNSVRRNIVRPTLLKRPVINRQNAINGDIASLVAPTFDRQGALAHREPLLQIRV